MKNRLVGSAYNPGRLFDMLLEMLRLNDDAGLSCVFQAAPAVISRTRNRQAPASARLLVQMREISNMSVRE